MSVVIPNRLVVVELETGKETKRMIKYVADQDPVRARFANVPDLYVRQTCLAAAFGHFPSRIRITIEEVTNGGA